MKIAFVIPHYPTQTHIFFWREITALRERGIDVHVLATRAPPATEMCHAWTSEALRSTTYLSPPSMSAVARGAWLALVRMPSRGREVRRRIRDVEASGLRGRLRLLAFAGMGAVAAGHLIRLGAVHVHAHSCADAALVACFAAAWAGVPYSMTLHGPIEHYREAQGAKWRHAAFGIAVTRKLREQVLGTVPGVDPAKVHVAAMGVDVTRFRRSSAYAPPAAGEPWRIATCGRLHRAKGHQDLVSAVGLLRDRGRLVVLTVIGEGEDRDIIEDRIKELGLGDQVTLAGAIDSDRVRETLERSHLFALASHDEAIGVATMEAMAMELPVVVSDVGGVRELVREGIDGLFAPAESPAAFADAIERVIDDPSKATSMGASGMARVRSEFHAGVSAELIASLLTRASPESMDRAR